MDSAILEDKKDYSDIGEEQDMDNMSGIAAVGSAFTLHSPFQNIPCIACASNCFIKPEPEETSEEWSLTGQELLIKLLQLLRTRKGSLKVFSWDSERDEGIPICRDCKGKLILLFELEGKLRELEQALENGVKEYRKLCEDAEGRFQRDGIYDNDGRYYKFRRQIVRSLDARTTGPRRKNADLEASNPPRRSLRSSNSSSNLLPVVAVSAEERAIVDQYQMVKTEVPSSNELISDNDSGSDGFQLDSPTPVNFDEDADFVYKDEALQNNSLSNKRNRQRKSKPSSHQSASSKSQRKSNQLNPAASTSRSRTKRKISKSKTEMTYEDDDSEEDLKTKIGKKKRKESDDDMDYQLDGESEGSEPYHKKKPMVVRECPICGKPCIGVKQRLQRHMYTHYNEQDKVDAIARGENLQLWSGRDAHKKFQCDHCGNKYTKNYPLQQHILVKHSKLEDEDEAKIEIAKELCTECGVLLRKSHLAAHMLRVHNIGVNGEEPPRHFICSLCDKRFLRSVQLVKHRKLVHEKINLPFKCTLCPKAFISQRLLKIHIDETHNNVRPFSCEYCPLTFFRNAHLIRHAGIYHAEGSAPKRNPFLRGIASGKTKAPGWWRKSGPLSDPLDASAGHTAPSSSESSGSNQQSVVAD